MNMKTIEIKCCHCGKISLKLDKRIKYKISIGQEKFYCSKNCAYNSQKLPLIIKKCLYCKKLFKGTKTSSNCCSKQCSGRYSQSFVNLQNISIKCKDAWRRGCYKNSFNSLKKYKICSVCGNSFYGNKIYCSTNCLKNSPWKNNISLTRKQMFKTGNLNITGGTTKWIKYKNIKVQGSYEYRVCIILDKWLELKKIKKWEYTNDRFQYVGIDKKQHNYLLDFKVWNNDNTFYYLETKGFSKENDNLKWNAVKDAGFNLKVWFNDDIKSNEISMASIV
jgi:hypothetical protein